MSNLAIFYSFQSLCSIPMDMAILLALHRFNLTYSNCCKNILSQRQQNFERKWYQKLPCCIWRNIWIDYVMGFGPEQEDGSLITPMAMAHSLHSVRSNWNTFFLRDFNCIVQDSFYYDMYKGTMWHSALVSCTQSQSIGLVLGCAVPVLSAIMCPFC